MGRAGRRGLGLIGELLLVIVGLVVAMIALSVTDPELTARLQTIVTQMGRNGRGLACRSSHSWRLRR